MLVAHPAFCFRNRRSKAALFANNTCRKLIQLLYDAVGSVEIRWPAKRLTL
jgi:hypothetical protein